MASVLQLFYRFRPALFVLWLVACPTLGRVVSQEPDAPAISATMPSQLRVLSYNIHHGRGTDDQVNLERIAQAINRSKAFPAPEPTKQIDYVLFRPADSLRVVSTEVLDERQASDHRPLLTVLEPTRPRD